ncbi:hypothetical protein KQI38_06780 [Tissierella carlieri]|jgi:hypothetical protein|uniref:hypothetical protein n=1 Tax=Tissierella TaxID=41273 RepID=UPI001C103DF4|nr:hypothetical protein [Tissierella carlieri]MBU5311728.1 hypothetical protein [Tissierella carlieri]MDU5080775.1 hypothetical protein [Bacillota bacterium]
MKKIVFIIVAIVLTATVIGIIKRSEDNVDDFLSNSNNFSLDKSIQREDSVDEIVSDFSIKVEDKYISIREHHNNLSSILGTPISEEIEILGEESDTFNGSRIKTLTYDGLIIEEFSPEKAGNGGFWILSMTVTNENYSTEKGLTIGDKLDRIKELYGNVEILKDGRTDSNNCAYIFKDDVEPNFIVFEVEDGITNEIRIYHELQ